MSRNMENKRLTARDKVGGCVWLRSELLRLPPLHTSTRHREVSLVGQFPLCDLELRILIRAEACFKAASTQRKIEDWLGHGYFWRQIPQELSPGFLLENAAGNVS